MPSVNKIKGILLIAGGGTWITFVYNFDIIMRGPRTLGSKSILCFIAGLIAIINGIRIYRRKA